MSVSSVGWMGRLDVNRFGDVETMRGHDSLSVLSLQPQGPIDSYVETKVVLGNDEKIF